jgi:hypothetical protein
MLDTAAITPADIPSPSDRTTSYLPVPASRGARSSAVSASYAVSRASARGARRRPALSWASYVLAGSIVLEGLAIYALLA